jgi:hypothetical protein
MIQGDTTSKASSLAFNKLRLGFTRLGRHTVMWTETLIPAETESEQACTQAYKVSSKATRALLELDCCECPSCEVCSLLDKFSSHLLVNCCMDGRPTSRTRNYLFFKGLGDALTR